MWSTVPLRRYDWTPLLPSPTSHPDKQKWGFSASAEEKLLCYSEASIDGSDVDLKSNSSEDLDAVA